MTSSGLNVSRVGPGAADGRRSIGTRPRSLIASGQMRPSGLAEVDAARRDGRWDVAYASPKTIGVPEDLQLELAANPGARAFFEELSSRNRYAILYRIEEAKRPETRRRRIEKFVAMLKERKTIH